MTAAVRALLTPIYWLAVVVVWLAVVPLLVTALPWWGMVLASAIAGAVAGMVAALAEGWLLDRCARYLAGLIGQFAAEWRKLLTDPPPHGGTASDRGANNGPAGPDSGSIHP